MQYYEHDFSFHLLLALIAQKAIRAIDGQFFMITKDH